MTTIGRGDDKAATTMPVLPMPQDRLTLQQIDAKSVAELAAAIEASPAEMRRIERRLIVQGRAADVYALSRALAPPPQTGTPQAPSDAPGGPGEARGPVEESPGKPDGSVGQQQAKPGGEAPTGQSAPAPIGAPTSDVATPVTEAPEPPMDPFAELDAATAARIGKIKNGITRAIRLQAWNHFTSVTAASITDRSAVDSQAEQVFDGRQTERHDRHDQHGTASFASGDKLVTKGPGGAVWATELVTAEDRAADEAKTETPFWRQLR